MAGNNTIGCMHFRSLKNFRKFLKEIEVIWSLTLIPFGWPIFSFGCVWNTEDMMDIRSTPKLSMNQIHQTIIAI